MKGRNSFRYILFFLIIFLSIGIMLENHLQSGTDDTGILLESNPAGIAINPKTSRAVIANEKSDSVSVVDLHNETVLSNVPVGRVPRGVAIDKELQIAVIGNSHDDTVSIIDLNTYQIIATISVGKEPEAVAINPVNHSALAVNLQDDTVSVINLMSLDVIATIPVGRKPKDIVIDSEINIALVVNEEDYTVSVIDLNSCQETRRISVEKKPQAIAINPETHSAAVANEKDNSITVIDLQTWETCTISVGKHPVDIALNLLNNRALVICDEDRSMLLIDLDTLSIIKEYVVNKLPRGVAVNNFTNRAAIIDEKTDSLTLIQLPNPVPEIASLVPQSTVRGDSDLLITIEGKKFMASSMAYFGDQPLTTTFIDNNQIRAAIPAEMLSHAGIFHINVINPQPAGGTSNSVDFTVMNPVPSIAALEPSEAEAGIDGLALQVYGTGFFSDTEIYFSGMEKPTDYISDAKLQTGLALEDLKTPGQYEIMAYNPPPGGGNSNKVIFRVTSPLEITITSPPGGETINKSKVIVKGTVQADTNDIGITVDGIVAEVVGNEWIASNVPLTIGENTITATATNASGNTYSKTITIYTNDTAQQVELSANITSGISPLTTYFSESTSFIPVLYQMDFEGDGIFDYTGTTFEDISHTYSSEGIFYPTVTVIDDLGNIYSDTIAVMVLSKTEIDTLLKGKWKRMKDFLVEQDIEGALNYYLEESKQLYRDIYTAFFDQLPQLTQEMQDIQLIYLKSNTVKYRLRENEMYGRTMETITYYIYFVMDEDGLWKIYRY
jgi:YVTN family beta-propeller protein